MKKHALRVTIGLSAVAVTMLGVLGALSYGRDYNLHRGFATVLQLPRAGTGRLLSVDFHSAALRRKADYLVYLPPHYTPARRYPVYYLLHGMPGQPRVFVDIANLDVRLDNQLSLGRARPMILVYPDGRIGGNVFSDSEWANTPTGAFETYVIEVMHNVDHHFSTLAHRQDRVIAGFSAGAYGAINIALHHLADFANVQAWSGYFTQTRTAVFAHAGRAALAYNSPLAYVTHVTRQLAVDPLRTYMFVGRADSASRQLLPMVRALRARGEQVGYRFYRGGHDWSVWYPQLNRMLDLASWDVIHPLTRQFAHHVRHPLARPFAHHVSLAGSLSPGLGAGSIGSGSPPPAARRGAVPRHRRRAPLRGIGLIGVLLLTLISAALINLGFVLQHRGRAQELADGRASLAYTLRNRVWLGGQALGWIGFSAQIVAVALAPLTLVQAFAAGSLAISVPLAVRLAGQRVRRAQLVAVAVVAVSLASLPVGFSGPHGHLHPGSLLIAALIVLLVAIPLALHERTATRAIAAGALYGLADAAIKADALALRVHGPAALLSGWTILAALSTLGGFLAFQAALRRSDPVQPISLMTAFTAITAVAMGIGGFGEALGATPAASAAHLVAIALVLACVRPLTEAQEQLTHADEGVEAGPADADRAPASGALGPAPSELADRRRPQPAAVRRIIDAVLIGAGGTLAVLAVSASAVTGIGLLYSLRQLHWFAFGPSVPDALPLLQLAGFAGQPLGRVIAAWIPVGLALGIVLIRLSPPRRVLLVALFGAVLLLFASDASYALARNLRLGAVLIDREPGIGPWLECLLLAAGATLARPLRDVPGPSALRHRLHACIPASPRTPQMPTAGRVSP